MSKVRALAIATFGFVFIIIGILIVINRPESQTAGWCAVAGGLVVVVGVGVLYRNNMSKTRS